MDDLVNRREAQASVGIVLSTLVIAGWMSLHWFAVHQLNIATLNPAVVVLIVFLKSWLSVGLFIVVHDAIHGSLAPGQRRWNAFFGHLGSTLYGGFCYRRLAKAHGRHHQAPGTEHDPDFSVQHSSSAWLWGYQFFRQHMSLRSLLFFPAVFNLEMYVAGASEANLIIFFCIPALLSAFQLFYFGTYLPHRRVEGSTFPDRHSARSTQVPPIVSLFTCYHFGYHHEHHLFPHEPWWRLPFVRGRLAQAKEFPRRSDRLPEC